VGDDQRQHIELAREIARRFNSTYGDILVEPAHRIPEVGARIMDLQEPSVKMSTTSSSEQGLVFVDDEPDAIQSKLKRAVTDPGRDVVRGEDKPGISNLIEILSVVREADPAEIESEFDGRGYGDFKQAVGEAIVDYLAPVRERYSQLRADEQALEAVLAAGAERARGLARETMAEVRRAMGVGPPL
jgi:tryptophanyl-tRNA synthetase